MSPFLTYVKSSTLAETLSTNSVDLYLMLVPRLLPTSPAGRGNKAIQESEIQGKDFGPGQTLQPNVARD